MKRYVHDASPLVLHAVFASLLIALMCASCASSPSFNPSINPLPNAHAHNDYQHRHPLLDAVDAGFCNVEADVFLADNQLLVGHVKDQLDPSRTLESLYLKPLSKRIKNNMGYVYYPWPFVLLIEQKTEPITTYRALRQLLKKYSWMLTKWQGGQRIDGPVTVIITGKQDRAAMEREQTRLAALDDTSKQMDTTASSELMPWFSNDWKWHFSWDGRGSMPDAERIELRRLVALAHAHGRVIRFWNTPDNPDVWREELDAGVDLINTDHLRECRDFLLPHLTKSLMAEFDRKTAASSQP